VSSVGADNQSRTEVAAVGAYTDYAVFVAKQPRDAGSGAHLGSRGAGGLDQ
jgi:hypothetical protein